MKVFILSLILISSNLFAADLYDFQVKSFDGKDIKLEDYKGKAVLLVNIATRCGYTGQLDGLGKLYKEYKDKNLVIVGIPSNDFGGQTPESNEGVEKFCRLNYGVNFPITEKMVVKGKDKSKLSHFLISQTDNQEIQWNFTKFLFDKKGKFVKRFNSAVEPSSKDLKEQIQKAIQ